METNGRLVVVGSGIKSIAHFTLEAKAHIQQADIVLYAAADPVTDMWIERQNPNSFDLYQYYANDKTRIITYTQMIERIMEELRAGKYVCALFYGHPGVFVTPSHNAIELARREGFQAEMLPAISADACLFADLGVDPSIPGLQTYEATDLLLRRRSISPDVNLVIFQVGCVGDVGFNFTGYENKNFHILLDYLEDIYGPDQRVINYVASMFSMTAARMDEFTIAELREPDNATQVSGISTFFIPAQKLAESDPEMAAKLGLKAGKSRGTPLICDHDQYPQFKKIALRNNKLHTVPQGYKFSHSSDALYHLVTKLALDFDELAKFKQDANGYLDTVEGLDSHERMMLSMGHHGALRLLFKRDPDTEASRFLEDALRVPELAEEYSAQQHRVHADLSNGSIGISDYEAQLAAWFLDRGYATTPGAATKAISGLEMDDPLDLSGRYLARIRDNGSSKDVVIDVDARTNSVKIDDIPIVSPSFGPDVLMWLPVGGNRSSAILAFAQGDSGMGLSGKYADAGRLLPEEGNVVGALT